MQRRSGGLSWMSGQPGCRPMRIRRYARMRDPGGDTVGQDKEERYEIKRL